MAKLYFRYGAVDSAKTLNLLAVNHNYLKVGRRALLVTPAIDTRFGTGIVKSRAGLEAPAGLVIQDGKKLRYSDVEDFDVVLVDEAQFLAPITIDSMREIVDMCLKPVIAYGLRTDFRGLLFPGSRRLMELADEIEEVKSLCTYCTRKATHNLRLDSNGNPCIAGKLIEIGDTQYKPVCYSCYLRKITQK